MIKVTCAIIRNEENEILVVQRGEKTDHPLKWEFPGGKMAWDESDEECIIREIKEELSMEIIICRKLNFTDYDYGYKQIHLIPFVCDTLDELPLLSEHLAYRWVVARELVKVDFSEADVIVAQEYLKELKVDEETEKENLVVEQTPADDEELQSMVNNMMSMKEVEWVATSAIENPAIFNKLFEFSFSADKKLAFRASWTLTKVCDKFPEMIYPHMKAIIEKLGRIDNESAHRSFLRIISLTEIDMISQKQHGILADHCFKALNSGFTAIAIKAYSMEILYKLAVRYPELANELSASINFLQGEGSAGIVARGRMILKKLAEITSDPESSH